MSALIQRLAHEGSLLCPSCRQAQWKPEPDALHCEQCNTDWPVRNGVPDLFNRYRAQTAEPSGQQKGRHAEWTAAIVQALELDTNGDLPERVAEIVSRASNWACSDSAYTAEINDLLDRFAPSPVPIEMGPLPAPNHQPAFQLVRHYLPEALLAGTEQSVNFRVTNSGDAPWSSRIEQGLRLSARWLGVAAADTVPAQTRFPIDIAPGRTITLPLRLVAPAHPGRYGLRLQLQRADNDNPVGEGVDLPVRIVGAASAPDEDAPIDYRAQIVDYGEDHAAGVEIIASSLREAGIAHARILEVGAGTHPYTAWLTDHEVVALDISSPLLELGALYFGDRFTNRLGFLCADAFDAPFAPGQFDLVCMFSTLHHFQEPETVLRQLAIPLKPDGLLAVSSEPVGDSLEQPETVRDLLKGINEQVFSAAEYQRIFAAAGLVPTLMRIDGGSLKAILKKKPA